MPRRRPSYRKLAWRAPPDLTKLLRRMTRDERLRFFLHFLRRLKSRPPTP